MLINDDDDSLKSFSHLQGKPLRMLNKSFAVASPPRLRWMYFPVFNVFFVLFGLNPLAPSHWFSFVFRTLLGFVSVFPVVFNAMFILAVFGPAHTESLKLMEFIVEPSLFYLTVCWMIGYGFSGLSHSTVVSDLIEYDQKEREPTTTATTAATAAAAVGVDDVEHSDQSPLILSRFLRTEKKKTAWLLASSSSSSVLSLAVIYQLVTVVGALVSGLLLFFISLKDMEKVGQAANSSQSASLLPIFVVNSIASFVFGFAVFGHLGFFSFTLHLLLRRIDSLPLALAEHHTPTEFFAAFSCMRRQHKSLQLQYNVLVAPFLFMCSIDFLVTIVVLLTNQIGEKQVNTTFVILFTILEIVVVISFLWLPAKISRSWHRLRYFFNAEQLRLYADLDEKQEVGRDEFVRRFLSFLTSADLPWRFVGIAIDPAFVAKVVYGLITAAAVILRLVN